MPSSPAASRRPRAASDVRTVALIAAHDEAERVAATVAAVEPLVDEVVVVDDASEDATASTALVAGATVLRASRRRGKGRALEEALERLGPAEVWLFADADLGASAGLLSPLLVAVRAGRADIAIARFPKLAMLADRASVRRTYGMPIREALRSEWVNGHDSLVREGVAGAARFAAGKGRHGDFREI